MLREKLKKNVARITGPLQIVTSQVRDLHSISSDKYLSFDFYSAGNGHLKKIHIFK